MIKALYLHPNFFKILAILAGGFVLSYWVDELYPICWLASTVLGALTFLEFLILFASKKGLSGERSGPAKLSNGDPNPLSIHLKSKYSFVTYLEIIDELPVQFQKRDFLHQLQLPPKSETEYLYSVRPVERGEYYFGNLNVYVSSALRLVRRRYRFENNQMMPVYPSLIQMQKYDFLAISNKLTAQGLKRIRRIGHTQEFEQIKEYTKGDDVRTINWKATAKKNDLMVNQYQDEKSQPIYCLIDTGRVMKMPFEGLTLLDYAINTSLAFSNVALKKADKTGMLAFSKNINAFVPAAQKITHLNQILEKLYSIQTDFRDSNYAMLYAQVKRKINHRSLLLLFTNFEHISGLKRQLPYLRGLAKQHLLVVIFFENTEIEELVNQPAGSIQEIYHKTIAEKFQHEKQLMRKEMIKNGIQVVLTKPEELTINTINKYLEIKARGLL